MSETPLYRDLPDSFDPPPPAPEAAAPSTYSDYSWKMSLSVFLASSGLLTLFWFITPKFVAVYEEVKLPLSALTLHVVLLSKIACRLPWVIGGFALAFAVWSGTWPDGLRRVARIALPLLVLMAAGIFAFALFDPLLACSEHGIGRRR